MSERTLSLGSAVRWALAGNAFYSATQLAVLILLAKWGSAEMVGRYGLGLALCAPIVAFASLKLGEVQATDAGDRFGWSDYFGLRLVTTTLALLVIAGVAAASGYRGEAAVVVGWIAVAKGVETLSELAHGMYLRHGRNDLMARSQGARGWVLLGAFGLGVGLVGSLPAAVALQFGGWAAVAVIDLWAASELASGSASRGPRFDVGVLRELAWFSFPLGVTVAIGSLQVNVPRLMLERTLGEAELGIFTALCYVMVVGNVAVRSVSLAVTPRLAALWFARDRGGFARLLGRAVGIAVSIGVVGLVVARLAGEPILALLYDARFSARVDVLQWLMVASALTWSGLFLGASVIAMRRFRAQALVHGANLVAVAAGCWLWVEPYGMTGAAWGMVAGAATSFVLFAAVVAAELGRAPREEVAR